MAHGADLPVGLASAVGPGPVADATDAARLDLALGRPVLVVDSTDVDAEGTPLLTKRTRFAAERVEFVIENG